MKVLAFEDLWEKEAYDGMGHRLGLIEAVGMGRDRVPRRVGVRNGAEGSPLRFFALNGAALKGGCVVLEVSGQPLRLPDPGSA
jgi:hypothetical protein